MKEKKIIIKHNIHLIGMVIRIYVHNITYSQHRIEQRTKKEKEKKKKKRKRGKRKRRGKALQLGKV